MGPSFSFAVGDYDRIRALWDGSVRSDQFSLDVRLMRVDQIFIQMVKDRAFDISEMSLSTYTIMKDRGDSPFVAIPIFLSRKFRHGDIYIRRDSNILNASDLNGKRIGVPEYQITAAVWLRGILQDDYGIKLQDIHWRTGGLESPGRQEKIPLLLPGHFDVRAIGEKETLIDLLRYGELDAIITPTQPLAFKNSEHWLQRLFPNYMSDEQSFFRRTGLFPIMHTVVVRKEVHEQNPWLVSALCDLFQKAKELCFARYQDRLALTVSVPWFDVQLDQARDLMGNDFWSYGIESNQKTLEVFLRYMKEQGLINRASLWEPQELFVADVKK
jgi:4,5-dihydroxyphthalate decarboxylase